MDISGPCDARHKYCCTYSSFPQISFSFSEPTTLAKGDRYICLTVVYTPKHSHCNNSIALLHPPPPSSFSLIVLKPNRCFFLEMGVFSPMAKKGGNRKMRLG